MLCFTFSDTFLEIHKERFVICKKVFQYLSSLFKQPIQLNILFDIDNTLSSDFHAYTEILESKEQFPTKAKICFHKSTKTCKKRLFYYIILHESFHALGLMLSSHTKWKTLLDVQNKVYTGKHACSLFKGPIPLCVDDEDMTHFNHVSGYKDFFSESIYYRISPCTIAMLKDYGYKIHES